MVVQKSLAEGFGLTVAEAMWKARPVVASRIGGIQDQIVDGETGILLDDPLDLAAYGAAVRSLPTIRRGRRRSGARRRSACSAGSSARAPSYSPSSSTSDTFKAGAGGHRGLNE